MRPCSRNTPRLRFEGGGHDGDHAGGRADGAALEIDEGVDGFAGGEEFFAAEDFVIEADAEEGLFA